MYTKKQFGLELEQELIKKFDVIHISRWAFKKYLKLDLESEKGVDDIIMTLVAMEEGPEFEYTKEELLTDDDEE